MSSQIEASLPIESVQTLLSGIIDYAGLFPPSMVSMGEAAANFAFYKNAPYGWMLGRFVVPVARLDEFIESARELPAKPGESPWRLSVLAGEDINATIRDINLFNGSNAPRFICDSLEVKANTVSKIENTVAALPPGLTTYFEIAAKDNFDELIATLSLKHQRAKIRTGGVTNDEFPPSREIIRFVCKCMAANVPFKATAGLHHPIRCFQPLTYAPDAPQGTMHGFLNMLLMTGFARESYPVAMLEELMEEEFEEAFKFRENGAGWRGEHFLTAGHLERLRSNGLTSFGSCSFDEPIADLRKLGIL